MLPSDKNYRWGELPIYIPPDDPEEYVEEFNNLLKEAEERRERKKKAMNKTKQNDEYEENVSYIEFPSTKKINYFTKYTYTSKPRNVSMPDFRLSKSNILNVPIQITENALNLPVQNMDIKIDKPFDKVEVRERDNNIIKKIQSYFYNGDENQIIDINLMDSAKRIDNSIPEPRYTNIKRLYFYLTMNKKHNLITSDSKWSDDGESIILNKLVQGRKKIYNIQYRIGTTKKSFTIQDLQKLGFTLKDEGATIVLTHKNFKNVVEGDAYLLKNFDDNIKETKEISICLKCKKIIH